MSRGVDTLSFSETNSADMFAARLSSENDRKLPRLMMAVVKHVHELIREFRPNQDEWRQVLAFLTDVGHASDERRQEWVLLSDLLGASALVEEINTRRPANATPNTIRGPFYRSDTPERALGSSISLDGIGQPLCVSARVHDLDGLPIAGAEVITWQANAQGFYENQQPDLQPEHNLRGLFRSDAEGRVHYKTVIPKGYRVPDDGPVGKLLSDAGFPLHRPAHLHFVIRAKGFETITTHLYDGNDPHLQTDALFGVKPALVRAFAPAAGDGVPARHLEYTFVMVRAKPEKTR